MVLVTFDYSFLLALFHGLLFVWMIMFTCTCFVKQSEEWCKKWSCRCPYFEVLQKRWTIFCYCDQNWFYYCYYIYKNHSFGWGIRVPCCLFYSKNHHEEFWEERRKNFIMALIKYISSFKMFQYRIASVPYCSCRIISLIVLLLIPLWNNIICCLRTNNSFQS